MATLQQREVIAMFLYLVLLLFMKKCMFISLYLKQYLKQHIKYLNLVKRYLKIILFYEKLQTIKTMFCNTSKEFQRPEVRPVCILLFVIC